MPERMAPFVSGLSPQTKSPPQNAAGLQFGSLLTRAVFRGSLVLINRLAGTRIKEQSTLLIVVAVKVEHLRNRVCDGVKRTLADSLTPEPGILNESQDRALISH
jgi:hypothetical protein